MSAIAGIIETVSQANYAAGNTYQDALVNYRHANERQVLVNVRIHRPNLAGIARTVAAM